MITKVQKWGNSLAVRIPRTVAEDIHLSSGGSVNLAVHEGKIVIAPTQHRQYKLNDLLRGVTIRNKHDEVSTGKSIGHEVW